MTSATTSLLAILLVLATPAPAANAVSPVGVWRTFDDAGHESGKVEIWAQGNSLYGRIIAILDPAKAGSVCFKCTDDRRDKPALGLQIIRGMHSDGERWDGGEILDPENGRVYSASMRLIDGGKRLVVRGFLGISLLGRSQTWTRAE